MSRCRPSPRCHRATRHVIDEQAEAAIASSSRRGLFPASLAISARQTTRAASCRTARPRPTPSHNPIPVIEIGRLSSSEVPGRQGRTVRHGDHLGQHHRRVLQRLDFSSVIGRCACSDDSTPRVRPARTPARRGTSGRFPRPFRQVRKAGGPGIGQVERPRFVGDVRPGLPTCSEAWCTASRFRPSVA